MAEFKSKAGSFLPFLEASRRKESSPQSAPGSPLTLLEILARQTQQALPLFDLQTLGNVPPSRYAEALKSLRDAGYITIAGEAPEQVVRLTDSGFQVDSNWLDWVALASLGGVVGCSELISR
jgi:hypothetical protein